MAQPPPDTRGIGRTNLFLAATLLAAESGAVPIKIRNLSPSGALIEGAALPPPGAIVRLLRGTLAIGAAVVWNGEGRCGIAFDGTIAVREWMSPPANGEQQRIDAAIADLRSGRFRPVEPVRTAATFSVAAELQLIGRLVEQLGDALAGDEAVLIRHPTELQKIDIVLQLIEATAGAAEGRDGGGARLADLRASAEQALRSGAG